MAEFSSKRIECPKCGARRGFAPFINAEGGYCHACGYTINNKKMEKYYDPPPFSNKPEKFKTLSYDFLNRFHDFSHSNFSRYYSRLFGPGFEEFCKNNFSLRSDKFGALVIPYFDYNGELRTIKSIPFKDDGHRDKKGFKVKINGEISNYPSIFGYRFSRVNGNDMIKGLGKSKGYFQCLFNEFYLNPMHYPYNYDLPIGYSSRKVVFLLESEKSVIISSYFYPQYIFVASGGLSGLTKDKARNLKGFAVLICFDNEKKAQARAKKTKKLLEEVGADAWVLNLFKIYKAPKDFDIADAIEYLFKKGKSLPFMGDI